MVSSTVPALHGLAVHLLSASASARPVAAPSQRLGDAHFMAIGPAVIFAALIAWVTVVLMTSRKRHHYPEGGGGLSDRRPVMGGVILGSPSQRTRRDPAPSVTHREVIAHIERARAEEEAARAAAEAERSAVEGRPRRRRRRPGLPRLR
jgi:hypothetical protein